MPKDYSLTSFVDIYKYFIISDIPEQNYLGCFNDFNNQLEEGFMRTFKKTNSPRRCFNICRHLGFKYSGVENRWDFNYIITF